jgi:predicted metal-binding membrane protein
MNNVGMAARRLGAPRAIFIGAAALLFVASAAATFVWCAAMEAMGGTPMPGGWTMSQLWAPMCGQTWLDAAVSFAGMWNVMMVAMMLPSLVPVLWRYLDAASAAPGARASGLTALAGAGYFLVWLVVGLLVFAAGAQLAAIAREAPVLAHSAPVAAGVVVVSAGVLQFTAWKVRWLAGCVDMPTCTHAPVDVQAALRHGLRLGRHCVCCCGNLMAALLAAGVMDRPAMALVAAAISAERLVPAGGRVARGVGVATVVVGVAMVARAVLGHALAY